MERYFASQDALQVICDSFSLTVSEDADEKCKYFWEVRELEKFKLSSEKGRLLVTFRLYSKTPISDIKLMESYSGCGGGVGTLERAGGRRGNAGRLSSHASGIILIIIFRLPIGAI